MDQPMGGGRIEKVSARYFCMGRLVFHKQNKKWRGAGIASIQILQKGLTHIDKNGPESPSSGVAALIQASAIRLKPACVG